MNSNRKLIRMMSFNIRYDTPKDGLNSWTYRKDMVARVIRFHQPDIAGLQEVLEHQLEDLVERLPEFKWVGVGRNDGKRQGEFAAIFYLKDRFEPVTQGNFWLSENPELPGIKGWDANCVRIVTWVKFLDKESGKHFFHFNTHFDLSGAVARLESAYLLLNRVSYIAKEEPCLITGDFNSDEGSQVYNILTGKGIEREDYVGKEVCDAKYLAAYKHHGPSNTFLGKFEPGNGSERIDYIFVKNGIVVHRHGTIADHWEGKTASDHMPVISDVYI